MNVRQSKHPSLLKEFFIGYCLGTANIIPGVSGGTFLLVFKIYERVFSILSNINKANTIKFLSCIIKIIFNAKKAEALKNFVDFLQKNDFLFLFKLILGAVVAIVSLSSLMKYLIVYHFSITYALFFGLILISIIIPVKMLTDKRAYLAFFIVLGIVSTTYVTVAVNPYEKVKMKSDSYESQYLKNKEIQQEKSDIKVFSFIGKYTPDEYIYALICGAVAVSAMVLPGISGSLVLILMGEYFEVVSAISGLRTLNLDNMAFLGCFSIGIVFGGLVFARLINIVLKRYYNTTMAFLIGLMAGSLYALWPFKKSIIMAEQYIKKDGVISIVQNMRIYTNINELPQIGPQLYISLISFIIGCIIMFFFLGKEIQK
ncbi:MAG: DUF368 domain-containing protein [Deltaproteobacteria bacterium]|nr:MAG: DUF368 domain-containing protein [Deltaproteobacteria bacterium]